MGRPDSVPLEPPRANGTFPSAPRGARSILPALREAQSARANIFDKKWPKIVAHRGASLRHPENTLEAFEAAIAAGADVVELDVRLTADGVPVVMHDLDASRTTDGSGLVHELPLEALKRFDASRGLGPRTEVPTVSEALEVLGGRVVVNLELKNLPGEASFDSPREAVAEAAVGLVKAFGIGEQVLLSSFNWLTIERVRDLDPEIMTGFLSTAAMDPAEALRYARSKGHRFILPQVEGLLASGEELIQEAHDHEVLVGTWTVDEPEVLERLFGMGVDAVATNAPETAVPIRDAFRVARGGTGEP
jgi:glycerophosphoryl diester phosphodiesterase